MTKSINISNSWSKGCCYEYHTDLAWSIVPIVPIWVAITWESNPDINLNRHLIDPTSQSTQIGIRYLQGNDHHSCKWQHLFCSPAKNNACHWEFNTNPTKMLLIPSSFYMKFSTFFMQHIPKTRLKTMQKYAHETKKDYII